MKKLAYLVGIGFILGAVCSCEDEPKNPGKFDTAAELAIGDSIYSLVDPTYALPLVVKDTRDTTYARVLTLTDTVFEYFENGDSSYIYDASGNPLVNTRDTIVLSKKTAKLVEYETVTLESYADTLRFTLTSNARWMAKQPTSDKALWLYNYNSTEAGGGDSKVELYTSRNRSKLRGPVYQYVFTSDSMVCVKIPFCQKGERD